MALFGSLINDIWADPHVRIIGGCAVHSPGRAYCLRCQVSIIARWDVSLARSILRFREDRSEGNCCRLTRLLRGKGLEHHLAEILMSLNAVDQNDCPFAEKLTLGEIGLMKHATTRRLAHSASNRLYHNDVVGFGPAMGLVILMCEQERFPDAKAYPPEAGGMVELEVNEELERYAQIAKSCRDEFLRWKGSNKHLAEKWTAAGGEERMAIAAALMSGDYSGLAI